MASLPNNFITPAQYLELDRKAETKSEFFAGRMIAFAGANKKHNLLVSNCIAAIHRQLRGRDCNVYPGDMRVKISKTGMYAYPDVVVTCGEEQFADDKNDVLLNPVVLIEVLSESTANYDRGDKFEHYRPIESLREYILISQEPFRVDQYIRQNDKQWLITEVHTQGASLRLQSVEVTLSLDEIYTKVL